MKNIMTKRYKYKGYWVKTHPNLDYLHFNRYWVVIWIVGDPEHKQTLAEQAYSRTQGETQAEQYIDFKQSGGYWVKYEGGKLL